jgi:predicted Zn finger-like uncharacterized protein
MFTTCPKCALNLALTVADLRLGQGYVRCGRCANVFNALPGLNDEGDADDSATATATRPAMDLAAMRAHDEGVASIQVLETDAPPGLPQEPEPEFRPEPDSESKSAPEPDPEPVQAPTPLVIVPDDGAADPTEATGENKVLRTGTFETIVLEGDAITQTEETVAESEVDAQLQALVQRFDAVRETDVDTDGDINNLWPDHDDGDPGLDAEVGELDLSDAPSFDLDDAADSNPENISRELAASLALLATPSETTGARPAETAAASDDPLLQDDPASPPTAPRTGLWLAGAILLGVVLLGQVVHHFREDLASRPGIAGPLTAVYRLFHVTLEPRWDLAAYEVRQLGADAVPGAVPQIAVRASVRNRAPRAQPPPLLRVVLQDRFGKELATRDIAPADYLRGGVPATLGADQRIDASLTLPDPGQNAVGFEIDACLRSARGVLRCASDPPAP